MNIPFCKAAFAVLVLTGGALSTQAQSGSAIPSQNPPGGPPAGSTAPSTQTGTDQSSAAAQAQEVIVEGVPIEQSVLPTSRPVSSVFGTEMNILDTPRNATVFNANELRERDIQSIEQISRIVPSAYSSSRWGTASVPEFRGDEGEIYINGIRSAFNENGIPVNFNPVEALDAVPGPATVVLGPGPEVGGYVNLVTKAPYFDKFQGYLQDSVGTWDKYNWNLDFGGPIIKNKLAYRFSYTGQESADYYQNIRHDYQSVFAALSWMPNDKFKLDFDGSFYDVTSAEVAGINRPTQALIDHGLYTTGSVTSDFGFPTTTPGFEAVVTPTGQTHINLNRVITAPGDGEHGTNWFLQLAASYQFTDNFKVTNREYVESIERKKHSDYYYLEWVPDQYAYENRTEFEWKFNLFGGLVGGGDKPSDGKGGGGDKDAKKVMASNTTPWKGIGNDVIFGLDYRFEHARSYVEFENEDYNDYDLTLPSNTYNVPKSTLFGVIPLKVQGRQEYSDTGGLYLDATGAAVLPQNDNTLDSDAHTVGLFLQDNIEFTPWLSAIIGGRGDLIYIDSRDPLPAPGYAAAEDTMLSGFGSAEGSLNFKPIKQDTLYITYSYVETAEGSYINGGYGLNGGDSLSPTETHKKSQLYEAGDKISLFKDTLFISIAGFYQKRTTPSRTNEPVEIRAHGVEAAFDYQPNKNFSASLSGGWINAYYHNLPGNIGFIATPNVLDTFAPPYGTGVGSPSFGAFPTGNYRVPDLPNVTINAYARYTLDCGLGVSGGVAFTGPQHLDVLGHTRIPAQYTLNASVFYNWRNWEARCDFYNITNETNWSGIDPAYGQDLVVRELPFHVLGTIKYKF